MKNNIDNFCNY